MTTAQDKNECSTSTPEGRWPVSNELCIAFLEDVGLWLDEGVHDVKPEELYTVLSEAVAKMCALLGRTAIPTREEIAEVTECECPECETLRALSKARAH